MIDQWIGLASGFLLVFAINDKETFEALKIKVKRIEKNEANNIPVIIVGNKCDLQDQREVPTQDAEAFAKSINAKYFETSALNDMNGNVKTVFSECASMILQKGKKGKDDKKKCAGCSVF